MFGSGSATPATVFAAHTYGRLLYEPRFPGVALFLKPEMAGLIDSACKSSRLSGHLLRDESQQVTVILDGSPGFVQIPRSNLVLVEVSAQTDVLTKLLSTPRQPQAHC